MITLATSKEERGWGSLATLTAYFCVWEGECANCNSTTC